MTPLPENHWFVRFIRWSDRYTFLYWSGGDAEMKRLLGDDPAFEPLRRYIRRTFTNTPEYMVPTLVLTALWITTFYFAGPHIEKFEQERGLPESVLFIRFALLTTIPLLKFELIAARFAGKRYTWRVLAANSIPICIMCGYDFRKTGETICPKCGTARKFRRRR